MTPSPTAQTRPVILIPPTHVPADEDIRLAQNYADAVVRAGGAPVILPLTADESVYETLFPLADGVLLTGGHDVDPALYGHTAPDTAGEKSGHAGPDPSPKTAERAFPVGEKSADGSADGCPGASNAAAGDEPGPATASKSAQRLGASGDVTPLRDAVEYALLDYAFAHNLPVYGICRGIQILNVYLGGTLWYDLPTRYEPTWPAWAQEELANEDTADNAAPCGTPQGDDGPQEKHAASGSAGSHAAEPCALLAHNLHKPNGDYDGDSYAHDARFAAVSRLAAVFGCRRMPVNSLHHQALGIVAPDLAVTAVSPDGVIEAVEHRDRPNVMAVQWHPEYFACADEKDDGRMGRFFSALVADAQAFKTAR